MGGHNPQGHSLGGLWLARRCTPHGARRKGIEALGGNRRYIFSDNFCSAIARFVIGPANVQVADYRGADATHRHLLGFYSTAHDYEGFKIHPFMVLWITTFTAIGY
jgi:hypothetical protein